MAGGEEFKFFKHWFWSHHNVISDPNHPPPQRVNFINPDDFQIRLKNIYQIIPDLLPGEYEGEQEWYFYSMWGRKYNDATKIENFRIDNVEAYWCRASIPDIGLVTSDGTPIGVTKTFKYFLNGSPTTWMMDVSRPHDPLERLGDWVLCKIYNRGRETIEPCKSSDDGVDEGEPSKRRCTDS